MKRRIIGLITALALSLSLCPTWVLAADWEPDTSLCPHHRIHTEECGYVPEDAGAPCAFVCRVCPVEALIGTLPYSVTPDNQNQVEDKLSAILALYTELTDDEQAQVDLSRCFGLQAQLDAANTPALIDNGVQSLLYELAEDESSGKSFDVDADQIFDAKAYTYTATKTSALIVLSGGKLTLRGSAVTSQRGAGVEVRGGGSLIVDDPRLVVTGTTYGLDVSSGAEVHLSGGTFTGKTAVRAADGKYDALLAPGYAYFDISGNPIPLADVAKAKTVVIQQCTAHLYGYASDMGAPTHSWTCAACGKNVSSEPCTFDFDASGTAECAHCGNRITISVDETSLGGLIYNGQEQTANVALTVALSDGTVLPKDIDYEVSCSTRTDVGEITVTVAGKTYNGTFTKTYSVTQAQPTVKWNSSTCNVNYSGSSVKVTDLPGVTITAASDDLSSYIQYSYKKDGETDFTDGLPTNAGTYEIKASLPEQDNYKAAETTPCLTLTINKIPAVITAPVAKTLTYNRGPQELVTAGVLKDGAIAEGAKIEFARAQNGTYSTDIPTGITVSNYEVWYKVNETENYTGGSWKLTARINHRELTPTVELSYYTTLYDGGVKEPTVTVKDGEAVVPNTEYNVTYSNNQNVGTATVTVTNIDNTGNYKVKTATATFQITLLTQDALSITGQPNTVTYGDTFTMGTSGGSGNGVVTWKITTGKDTVATVDENSGQVTVKGVGTAIVQATKSGKYNNVTNYEDAIATWTFNVVKKPVVATVTADDKTYNGDKIATVHAVVEQGVLPGDVIAITGLTGTFDDENAGTNKTVTVTGTPTISGKNSGYYDITYSGMTATADITKAEASIKAGPTAAALTYSGIAQELLSAGADVDIAGIPVEYALSKNGPYSEDIPKATNAGDYEIWYRVKETDNYFGTAAASVSAAIQPKLVSNPVVTPFPTSYVYDGNAKEPTVTVQDGGTEIPASEYTVVYSNNINAGEHTAAVTVMAKADGNYRFDSVTAHFTIQKADAKLTGSPQAKSLTYTGSAQELVTVGTAVNGKVMYSDNQAGPFREAIPKGDAADTYTVWYKVQGDSGYNDTAPQSVQVTIQPKTVVSPVITLGSYDATYDGSAKKPGVTKVEDNSTVIPDTEYTVTYSDNTNAGTATVHIINANGGNYIVNGSTTFEIVKGKAAFAGEPEPKTGLAYNGTAQRLVTAGTPAGGTVVYSLDGEEYSTAIPTATSKGDYTVSAKVQGDANHEDSEVKTYSVSIGVNDVTNPTVELSSSSFTYNGSEQKPTVTVKDNDGNVIPANEYDVAYDGDTVNVGGYKVKITGKGTNYNLTAEARVTILAADQTALTITGKPNIVYYGDTLQLGTTGGSGNGAVTWSVEDGTDKVAAGGSAGQFEIKGVGSITIKAVRTSSGTNYAEVEDTWQFYAYRKPVTALVTAANKAYTGDKNATLTATVNDTDLVFGDTVSLTVEGHFEDTNVGTNKTVIIDKLDIPADVSEKYDVTCPATTTASITPAPATVTGVTKKGSLTYTGRPQELVTRGTATGGTVAYSLDGVNYSLNIPTATDAGTYKVWYKAIAYENYEDSEPQSVDDAAISANSDTPRVMCVPGSIQYDGTEKTPTVVVRDEAERVIPESEYTVEFDPNRVAIGTYSVKVKDNPGGNYDFADATGTFEIVAANQNPLTIVTDKPANVCYGDTFRLSATGGSGNGAIQWSVGGSSVADIDANGVVTVKGVGVFVVTAQRAADGGYSASNTDSVPFEAKPKPVTPVVTAADKSYDGKTDATLSVSWKAGDLVGADTITVTVTGEFVDANVGTNKQVKVETKATTGNTENYEITCPATATASIYKVDAQLQDKPAAKTGLVYSGGEKELLASGGTTENGIGKVEYSLSEKGEYSPDIPKATNAGTYTVWYRVADSVNYTGIGPVSVEVKIDKAPTSVSSNPTVSGSLTYGQSLSELTLSGGQGSVAGSFAWTNGSFKPEVGTSAQEVTFTPTDTINYKTCTAQINVTVSATGSGDDTGNGGTTEGGTGTDTPANSTPATSGPSAAAAPMQTSVRNGTATTVLNAAGGSELVRQAVANQSKNVIIKPEITGDVTKTEVSIPASTVSQLNSQTKADLTVSTPIADVTIPNAALSTLSSAGGSLKTVTEQEENTVTLTLTAGGKTVERVPGGVTLTVPVEDAAPGTVAVLVHEDGTRETIRKAVAEDGKISVPLDGSATVEIVDNSKDFSDVPAESWAADAVAFASAHELFNGTSETTFSPDQAMSRGMLATVLYNLEGQPDQDQTVTFSDVSSDAWYAAGVSWAAENGITNGYGDGQFAPNQSITREQFAVMLWRYAGSPAVVGQTLNFTDADKASDYALEALRWAAANGILNGYGDGQLDPGGLATRAQAAQMLKNFLENT